MFVMGVFLHYMKMVKKAIAVLIRILGKCAIAPGTPPQKMIKCYSLIELLYQKLEIIFYGYER